MTYLVGFVAALGFMASVGLIREAWCRLRARHGVRRLDAEAISLGCPRCEDAQPEAACNCLGDCGRHDCGRRPVRRDS
jgi:hypothetical protein